MSFRSFSRHSAVFVVILAGVFAAFALLACGGGSSSAGTTDPNKGQVEYQACLDKEAGSRPATPDDAWLAKFGAAAKDCQAKTGYQPPSAQNISNDQKKAELERSLKFAACMRQHGVNMPDPQITQNGIEIPSGATPPDPSSPTYKAANQACQSLLGPGQAQGQGGAGS